MRYPLLPLCLVALVSSTLAADSPAWRWTPEAIVDAVAVGNAVFSPDGSSIVFTRSRWRGEGAKPGPAYLNLWRVPAGGGEPLRLTNADGEDSRPRFSPDGSRLGFLSRRGEGAKTRIYVLPLNGGEAEPVSAGKEDIASFEWAPDGKTIAYLAVDAKPEDREKDEKAGRDQVVVDQDLRPRRLWILDLGTRRAEKLASQGDLSAWEFDWAPDGSALVATLTERHRTDDAYLLKRIAILPLAGELRDLVPAVGKIDALAWSKDGHTIAWLGGVDSSDPAAGSVFVVPASGGSPKNLTGERQETSRGLEWRRDGRLAVVSAVGTSATLELVDPVSGGRDPVVGLGVLAFAAACGTADGSRYALVGSTAQHEPEVFAASYAPAAKSKRPTPLPRPRRLTFSNPQLESLPRASQQTIRYRAQDGLEIEAILVRPPDFRENARYPLVVVAHGGPESNYSDGWLTNYNAPAQALAERGYLVLFPNYRGSTGRGVAFAKSDHKDLGGKEFTDVLDGIDFLVARGWADAQRVGITGGSYGGYFTALGATRYSERFAAGVDLFGITNWESYLGHTDIPVENSLVHWALWCYDQPGLCRERSAVGNLDRAKTPTLILQGQEDLRVPKPQSDELYAALRFKKVPVEYVVYPREPHGFRERAHRLDTAARLLAWMERYLGEKR